MTPQLQQAIRLLQLSTLDLKLEIQQAVEIQSDARTRRGRRRRRLRQEHRPTRTTSCRASTLTTSASWPATAISQPEQMPEDLPVDSSWDDVFQADDADPIGRRRRLRRHRAQRHRRVAAGSPALAAEPDADFRARSRHRPRDHRRHRQRRHADRKRRGNSAPASLPSTKSKKTKSWRCSSVIQQFDPPGVAARDLRECLLIQLNQLRRRHRLGAGGARAGRGAPRSARSARSAGADAQDASRATTRSVPSSHLIRSLNPRPGTAIARRRNRIRRARRAGAARARQVARRAEP